MRYDEKVIDHYENPRNVGTLDKDDDNVGTGLVGAPACGDVMRLQIRVNDEGIIEDARFKTFGCGSAIASSSLVTEWVKGKSIEFAEKLKNQEIVDELCLPPVKIHCSVLAEDAIKMAVADWRKKKGAGVKVSIKKVFDYTPDDEQREFLEKLLTVLLKRYDTERGVISWFDYPYKELEGLTPRHILSPVWSPDELGACEVMRLAGV